ncbi:uncharacterized protein HD556DRAFT_1450034 [Suillus plorans]|uniref:Uncharacterized protein n=1 Tax=Suillus plorans TaxID=116603 RepID=A0A9P7DBG1_9AGAM|nr:uncharacterized protein HD556DRAFT_1450034 [Suillus plorans]KAG1786053.1 hypothetical protein HD556DRAFT_1450034 [Suillus plorans]
MSAILHFKFASAIVFTAKRFQPLVASSFFLVFAELVLVEQLCVRKTFPELLALSGRLGLHTKVILMTLDTTSPNCQLECTTFARAHTQTQPWGIEVPAQCPQCGVETRASHCVIWHFPLGSIQHDLQHHSVCYPQLFPYEAQLSHAMRSMRARLPALYDVYARALSRA